MNVTVFPASYYGETTAVPSKSQAHRLLIAAALKKGETLIKNIGDSEDVRATAFCLNELGAEIRLADGNAYVMGVRQVKNGKPDAGESGSTLRFLLPVAAALGAECTFSGKGRLFERPNEALCRVLGQNGVECDGKSISGQLTGGDYHIDATVSSQYLTGLLFALPLLERDSRIIPEGEMVSKNYIDMTLDVLKRSGIIIEKTDHGFFVPGRQKYSMPDEVTCEGDWSGAAFMLSAGAIGGCVRVRGLNKYSLQGDKAIVEILKEAGAGIRFEDECVVAERGERRPFSVSIENIPDLAPILAVIAAFSPWKSKLGNVHRLKLKESDRLVAIQKMLSEAGIDNYVDNDSLFIVGGNPKCGKFDGKKDHRMVMSEIILAGMTAGESVITDGEAVKKSYPSFYEDYKKIGGKTDVEVER